MKRVIYHQVVFDGGKSTYNPLIKIVKNDEVGSLRYQMALHVRTTRESFAQVCDRFFVNSSSVACVCKQNPAIGWGGAQSVAIHGHI